MSQTKSFRCAGGSVLESVSGKESSNSSDMQIGIMCLDKSYGIIDHPEEKHRNAMHNLLL